MVKAVIATGGKQYIVEEGDVIEVELLNTDKKNIIFDPLLVIDEDKAKIGRPLVSGVKVKAEILERFKEDKVIVIRYKSKKRVNKKHGHRQQKNRIKILKID
ncbi:50S ribosomal protein L21 [Candidatus Saccharibacteria bacterium]|nr:50S ribosomal protein L21 [Candidatus Saccharibacteria bacterium]